MVSLRMKIPTSAGIGKVATSDVMHVISEIVIRSRLTVMLSVRDGTMSAGSWAINPLARVVTDGATLMHPIRAVCFSVELEGFSTGKHLHKMLVTRRQVHKETFRIDRK